MKNSQTPGFEERMFQWKIFPTLKRLLSREQSRMRFLFSRALSAGVPDADFHARPQRCGPQPPRRAPAQSRMLPVLLWLAAAIAVGMPGTARAFRLHVPCTSSHDCPRGAFCRHATAFRGQCMIQPRSPFGITGWRQVEFPPQSDPPEHLVGSMPVLRCSQLKPCPVGFVCARYGSSKLEEARCVPYSEPCWSTADCSPSDICDKADDDFSLTGVCRPREAAE